MLTENEKLEILKGAILDELRKGPLTSSRLQDKLSHREGLTGKIGKVDQYCLDIALDDLQSIGKITAVDTEKFYESSGEMGAMPVYGIPS